MRIFSAYQSRYDAGKEEQMSIKEYLDILQIRPLRLRHCRRTHVDGDR